MLFFAEEVTYLAHMQLADGGLVVDPLLRGDVLVPSSRPPGVCSVLVPVPSTQQLNDDDDGSSFFRF